MHVPSFISAGTRSSSKKPESQKHQQARDYNKSDLGLAHLRVFWPSQRSGSLARRHWAPKNKLNAIAASSVARLLGVNRALLILCVGLLALGLAVRAEGCQIDALAKTMRQLQQEQK